MSCYAYGIRCKYYGIIYAVIGRLAEHGHCHKSGYAVVIPEFECMVMSVYMYYGVVFFQNGSHILIIGKSLAERVMSYRNYFLARFVTFFQFLFQPDDVLFLYNAVAHLEIRASGITYEDIIAGLEHEAVVFPKFVYRLARALGPVSFVIAGDQIIRDRKLPEFIEDILKFRIRTYIGNVASHDNEIVSGSIDIFYRLRQVFISNRTRAHMQIRDTASRTVSYEGIFCAAAPVKVDSKTKKNRLFNDLIMLHLC